MNIHVSTCAAAEVVQTFLNFLSSSIDDNRVIKVLRDAERNIIDVVDVALTVMYFLRVYRNQSIVENICNPNRVRVIDIILLLQDVKRKAAKLELVDGGSFYDIPIGRTALAYETIGLEFRSDYLHEVLKKYYA